MEFQRETGRIYAERDGQLIAEITFPEEDGVAVIDHTFVDGSLRGQGGGGPAGPRRRGPDPGPGQKSPGGVHLCPGLV